MGKSVISAQVHQRYFNHVLARHYCISGGGIEYRDPTAIVKSIMVQLYDRLPPYAAQLDGEFKPQLEEFLGQGFINAINLWKSFVVAPLGKIKPELTEALLAQLQSTLLLPVLSFSFIFFFFCRHRLEKPNVTVLKWLDPLASVS
jgi:hypothetical protein